MNAPVPPPQRPSGPPKPPALPRPVNAHAEATFNSALERPAAEREAFIAEACDREVEMLAEVRALLAAHEAAERPLADEAPLSPEIEEQLARLKPEEEGETIGPYKLREQIGEGGFGTVWVADQEKPVRRRVALKIIKMGMDTKEVIARFEQERQALAMMDHPNIAKVLDAGATQWGRPFFVMEMVHGVPITEYCDQNNLPTLERLGLFIAVCQAVQHAHQKGIIHRDIKPSNILLTLHDGVPVPKVIDFGIAKATEGRLTDATIYTQMHQFVGTPAYMSPEQAEMSGLDVDTRSDIYSLGVLLYELLTGRTPFDARELMSQGIDAMRRTIREQEPARPSTKLATLQAEELTAAAKRRSSESAKLLHQLRGDLDWIVMKCLEKDRTRRYDTANGLALDLQRHLDNEPVLARPASAAYKLRKAFRRNKLAFTAAGAVALALILGVIGTTAGLVRAEKQRLAAEEARNLAEHRYQSARRFVDDVFRQVEPEFANLIGASKASEALSRIGLTFVESLGEPGHSDESFKTDLAQLYARLSDALGNPYSENSLGDYEAALRFANQSLELWRDPARKVPSDFERRRMMGQLEDRIANILWQLGRYEEAKALFESSLKQSEAAVGEDPNPVRATSALITAHWRMGNVLMHEGRVTQALEEHYLPYGQALRERPISRPEEIRQAHGSYLAHVLVGDALLKLGRAADAMPHLEKASQWVMIKLEMDPNNARAVRDRSEVLQNIGAAHLALGQIQQGAQSLEDAVRNAEDLVARDSANGSSQLQLIDSLLAQADGFANQAGRPEVAPSRQGELWQRAIQTLARCQERMDSPALRQNKIPLLMQAKAVERGMNEARAALSKITTDVRLTPATPANDEAEGIQP